MQTRSLSIEIFATSNFYVAVVQAFVRPPCVPLRRTTPCATAPPSAAAQNPPARRAGVVLALPRAENGIER